MRSGSTSDAAVAQLGARRAERAEPGRVWPEAVPGAGAAPGSGPPSGSPLAGCALRRARAQRVLDHPADLVAVGLRHTGALLASQGFGGAKSHILNPPGA